MKRIKIIPIFLVMLIPLVVYGELVGTGLSEYPWYGGGEMVLDVFLYHKQKVLLVAAGLCLVFLVIMYFRKHVQINVSVFLPFALYVLLAGISSLFSSYKEYAFKGAMEQFESVWVIVGYFIICLYAYLAYSRDFFMVFGIFCSVIGAVGTLQLFGIDIYRTAVLQKLCMPKNLHGIDFHITIERGRSYCSLSNPNYAGMLCCLTIPVLAVLFFFAERWREKILYGISAGLMLCSLAGSRSKSGMVILVVCMLFLLVLFRKQVPKKRTIFIAVLMLAAGVAAGIVIKQWGGFSGEKNTPNTLVCSISTGEDAVQMVYDDRVLNFQIDYIGVSPEEMVKVTDESGNLYEMTARQGTLYFNDQALSQLSAALAVYGEYTALEIYDGCFYWYFTDQTPNHMWQYLTRYGKPDRLVSDEIAVFGGLNGRERIVSGRGYIWSRTIPLLKEYLLLGGGQDSFTVLFPNHDYLGKARWGYKDLIITKPHCMYMQIAVQSGILSLAVLLCFWGIFFIKAVSDQSGSRASVMARAVAAGVLGYLLMGMTNDSNIGVAPVFWLLLGTGLRFLNFDKKN